jgi:hypothetical protein
VLEENMPCWGTGKNARIVKMRELYVRRTKLSRSCRIS